MATSRTQQGRALVVVMVTGFLGAGGAVAAERAARASERARSPHDTLVSTEIASDRTVTFRIHAPKAGEVLVRGDLIEGYGTAPLTRDDTGVWSVTLGPLVPSLYSYSFVVDGVNTIDPKNTEIKPGLRGIDNMRTGSRVPRGETGAPRRDPDRLVPVSNASQPPPPDMPMPRFVPGATAGPEALAAWAALLGRFTSELMSDIVPFVERTYRVRTDPEGRALAGLSMGGLQLQRVLIAQPDAFAYVAIWSAGVRLGVPTEAFEKDAATFLAAPDEVNDSIRFLSIRVAQKDHALEGSRRLSALFKKHGIEHTLEENDGGHTWLSWRPYVSEWLPLLFR